MPGTREKNLLLPVARAQEGEQEGTSHNRNALRIHKCRGEAGKMIAAIIVSVGASCTEKPSWKRKGENAQNATTAELEKMIKRFGED